MYWQLSEELLLEDKHMLFVRLHLEAARRRGEPFDAAWKLTLRRLRRKVPSGTTSAHSLNGRPVTMHALNATRAHWQAAYEGTPDPRPQRQPLSLVAEND